MKATSGIQKSVSLSQEAVQWSIDPPPTIFIYLKTSKSGSCMTTIFAPPGNGWTASIGSIPGVSVGITPNHGAGTQNIQITATVSSGEDREYHGTLQIRETILGEIKTSSGISIRVSNNLVIID